MYSTDIAHGDQPMILILPMYSVSQIYGDRLRGFSTARMYGDRLGANSTAHISDHIFLSSYIIACPGNLAQRQFSSKGLACPDVLAQRRVFVGPYVTAGLGILALKADARIFHRIISLFTWSNRPFYLRCANPFILEFFLIYVS